MVIMFNFIAIKPIEVNAATGVVDSPGYLKKSYEALIMGVVAVSSVGMTAYDQIVNEELRQFASSSWDSLSATAKESYRSSMLSYKQGWSGAIELADETWFELNKNIDLFFAPKIQQEYIRNGMSVEIGTTYTKLSFPINSPQLFVVDYKGTDAEWVGKYPTIEIRYDVSNGGRVTLQAANTNWGRKTFSDEIAYSYLYKGASLVSISSMESAIRSWSDTVTNLDIRVENFVMNDAIYDPVLKRHLETDLPRMKDAGLVLPMPDAFHPTTKQRININDTTGVMTLPDGTIYTGDVEWKAPAIGTGVNVKGDTVAGWEGVDPITGDKTLTDIITGETIKTGEGSIPVENDGLWSKLWEWLKRILDAILSIPAAILSIPAIFWDYLVSLFVPTKAISDYVLDLRNLIATKIPIDTDFTYLKGELRACKMADIKANLYGKELTIVKYEYVKSASDWFKPIIVGLLWFLFGWYAWRKLIGFFNQTGGANP